MVRVFFFGIFGLQMPLIENKIYVELLHKLAIVTRILA